MTWADPRELVERAQAGGYAVGGFNMHSDETAQALVQAAEQANSPMFLQVGRAIVPHMGVRAAAELTRRAADQSGAELVLHLDHGPLDEVYEAIKLGFGSVMYDGAHLPFEDNIASTKHVVQVAHSFGIPVEAELGKIPDADEEVDWQSYYTDVAEAERFVRETGVDWLAISVGIVHGVPTTTPQPLDIQRIKDIKAATGIPLVLHGASGVPDDEIRAAAEAGVAKFNLDTELRHAFRSGIEHVWSQGDRQLEEALAEGRTRMVAATVEKLELFGCAGKAGGTS
jgi:fructose-bisphosphate aldolase, class II